MADSLVAVVQSVDERRHDLWVADTAKLVAQTVDRSFAILGVASGLRLVDQLRNLAAIVLAATVVAAAIGIVATASSRSGAAWATCRWASALRSTRSSTVRSTAVATSSGSATARSARSRSSALRSTWSSAVRGTGIRTSSGRTAARSTRGGSRTLRGTRSCAIWSTAIRATSVVTARIWRGTARIASLLAAAGRIPATAARFAARGCQSRASTLISVNGRAAGPSDHRFAARWLTGRSASARFRGTAATRVEQAGLRHAAQPQSCDHCSKCLNPAHRISVSFPWDNCCHPQAIDGAEYD